MLIKIYKIIVKLFIPLLFSGLFSYLYAQQDISNIAHEGKKTESRHEGRSVTAISEPNTITIEFAGIKWNVRELSGGPGPNNWSAGTQNVWVDNSGNLHLAIIKSAGKWYCSEITAADTMGYGEYSYSVLSDVEKFDPNVVAGLFIYESDSREIDIEFSRWGDATNNAGWYSVQPASPSSSISFPLNLSAASSIHKIIWTKGKVEFKSHLASGALIKEWTYIGANVPLPNQMKPHINFWLMSGLPPKNLGEAELVISNFKYTPLQLLTGISENGADAGEFKLEQNYPNPFNPATEINFQIPESGNVMLAVYDVLGRRIRTLLNNHIERGRHSIIFNGSNLPSGVYYYQLTAGTIVAAKKFILMK